MKAQTIAQAAVEFRAPAIWVDPRSSATIGFEAGAAFVLDALRAENGPAYNAAVNAYWEADDRWQMNNGVDQIRAALNAAADAIAQPDAALTNETKGHHKV